MHSMVCAVTFLLNVSYFKSFPCSTPESIQELLYNFELIDLVRYGNTRNYTMPPKGTLRDLGQIICDIFASE